MTEPTQRQIAEAICSADSILSLLYYRHRHELSDLNREAVAAVVPKLAALRKWYEPLLGSDS